MRTLLIDNYDSFTFNLFHLLGEVNGEEPIVVRNDEQSWEELAALEVDNIVISPGPGRPEHARDVGVSLEALRRAEVPLLGVCLGHQALAHVAGGAIGHAPEVMHGRASEIHHDGRGVFAGIPQAFTAVRYHSLAVGAVPPTLRVTAWTADDVVMGLEHRERPVWGVQFHPESISTEHGATLLRNFRDLTRAQGARGSRTRRPTEGGVDPPPDHARGVTPRRRSSRSTATTSTPCGSTARARSPGSRASPSWARPTARSDRSCATTSRRGNSRSSAPDVSRNCGRASSTTARASSSVCAPPLPELPFDFTCGFAGYLGYELKAECGGALVHRSPLPDAALMFCDRLLAFDHDERRVHLLALADPAGDAAAEAWLRRHRTAARRARRARAAGAAGRSVLHRARGPRRLPGQHRRVPARDHRGRDL